MTCSWPAKEWNVRELYWKRSTKLVNVRLVSCDRDTTFRSLHLNCSLFVVDLTGHGRKYVYLPCLYTPHIQQRWTSLWSVRKAWVVISCACMYQEEQAETKNMHAVAADDYFELAVSCHFLCPLGRDVVTEGTFSLRGVLCGCDV